MRIRSGSERGLLPSTLAGPACFLGGFSAASARRDGCGRADHRREERRGGKRGEPPSHEVIIEIEGGRRDGRQGRFRRELVDPDGYAALSAKGIAVVIEGLLGLAGRERPGPGLHLPEMLVETGHLMRRLAGFGLGMRET